MSTNKKPYHNPLTLEELHEAAKKRVSLITKEFTDGFEFIEKYGRSVTFFGGARFEEGSQYYEEARALAKKIVERLGYAIFTGGGPGVMEGANRGAMEAKGESLGLNIALPHEQELNKYTTDSINFFYFFSRKVCLSFSAEAYVIFPGGFGTFNELFEILTLIQTHKIRRVPIILFGRDFWEPLDSFIRKEMLGRGTVEEEDLAIYTITENEDEIIDTISKVVPRNGIRYHYPNPDKKD